ncbi:hypothetical protein ACG2F4_08375 [Halalkalibaculum sp. DA3122]|uniref:hypothetical protein n=1 Tax=unclassified Halalkalibaculum TaxID=2964617 RepID=UPI003754C856
MSFYFNIRMFSSLLMLLALAVFATSSLKAQEPVKFDYIKKKGTTYYAVLELPDDEFLVMGTRVLIRKNMEIERRYGRVGQIELLVILPNGRQRYIPGRIMDNGRNSTFYSRSSARQFVRRLSE